MQVQANGISIEVEDTGACGAQQERPVVLLIMGLGMQLVAWPPELIDGLVAAGYRVVRFDNRDIGLSQHFDHLGIPNVLAASLKLKLGLRVNPPYRLQDMAADAVGVLDALHIEKAHVLGASMGGMIAQRVALAAPHRTQSLISVMSSSGARGLPEADGVVLRGLFSQPTNRSEEALVAHSLRLRKLIGSPGFAVDEHVQRERILACLRRSYHPAGMLRQMMAIGADTPQRAQALSDIRSPTLVIHGKADRLVPYACGEDTARRIPGARLVGIEGMGHDLPPDVVNLVLRHSVSHMAAWPAH